MSDDLMDDAPISKKTMVMFFLIDTSGSMDGEKIETVNEAMHEIIPIVRDISNDTTDSEIKFAVLGFDSSTSWITPSPVDLNSYKYKELTAGGGTSMGEAFSELASKLDKNAFLSSQVGNLAPAIILLSDGDPTDDHRAGLNVLKQNKWYNSAIKVAFAIGKGANKSILTEFTQNSELVLEVDNKIMLKKLIKFVSVASSKVGSKTKSTAANKQEELVSQVREEKSKLAADPEANVSGGW